MKYLSSVNIEKAFINFALKAVFTTCILLSFFGRVQANTIVEYYNGLYGTDVTSGLAYGDVDPSNDPVFEMQAVVPTTGSNWTIESIENIIYVSLDENSLLNKGTDELIVTVQLEIESCDVTNNCTTVSNKNILLSYKPDDGTKSNQKGYFRFHDAAKVKVTIRDVVLQMNGTNNHEPPDFLRVESKILVTQKQNQSLVAPILINKKIESATKSFVFGWDAIAGAEKYDVEYTFYDEKSHLLEENIGVANDEINLFFKNNATRVTTGKTFIKIPATYPKGKLLVRVRGTRKEDSRRIEGPWSSDGRNFDNLTTHEIGDIESGGDFPPHEEDLNWTVQTIFAEEAKYSQTVSYNDGALKARQQVTLSTSTGIAIGTETVYDIHGRAAIQTMPAPISELDPTPALTPSYSWNQHLGYSEYFTAHQSGSVRAIYDYNDIDFNAIDQSNCSTVLPVKMSKAHSGVGRYYSNNNIVKDEFIHKYIPDSEEYPFSATEYMADQTGRIKAQGGVGETLQLGNGHATKYFYAKPDPTELDRLFGNEVGDASHYQKNAVLDPNGQVSVSYLDAHGRTIATALAGKNPSNVTRIPGYNPGEKSFTKDLLTNQIFDKKLISTATLFVTDAGTADLTYTLGELDFKTMECLDAEVCYSCLYDVEIAIVDECGEHYTAGGQPLTLTNVNPQTLDQCDMNVSSLIELTSDNLTLSLPVGTYQVTKTLTLSEKALQSFKEDYLSEYEALFLGGSVPPCFPSNISDLLNIDDCEMDCAACDASVGTDEATFVQAYLATFPTGTATPEDTENAKRLFAIGRELCDELCDEQTNECESLHEALIADMIPGIEVLNDDGLMTPTAGQYAICDVVQNTYVSSSDPTSIFFDDPTNGFPYANTLLNYKDEFGKDVLVDIDGVLTRPNDMSIQDFVSHFEISWAEALIGFHPEYCYLKCCQSNASLYDFEESLLNINSFSEATALPSPCWPLSELMTKDPFFSGTPAIGSGYISDMENLMNTSYVQDNISACGNSIGLIEIITSVAYCGGDLPCTPNPCGPQDDTFWELFRDAYLTFRSYYIRKAIEEECLPNIMLQTPQVYPTCQKLATYNFGEPGSNYEFKLQRSVETYGPPSDPEAEVQSMLDQALNGLEDQCEETADAYASQWMEKLDVACKDNADWTHANPDLKKNLKGRFKAILLETCSFDHPLGASSMPIGTLSSQDDADVFSAFSNEFSTITCDFACNASVIDFPGTYEQPQYIGPRVVVTVTQEDCFCENLSDLEGCYNLHFTSQYNTFPDYLNSLSDVSIAQEDIDYITGVCGEECIDINPIELPPYLECGVCKNIDDVNAVLNESSCNNVNLLPIDTDDKRVYAANILNYELGLNLNWIDYEEFIASSPDPCHVLCPKSTFPTVELDTDCSDDFEETKAIIIAEIKDKFLKDLAERFENEYTAHCINKDLDEVFTADITQREHHYTLYYYDQAGNLVKTVPPAGVDELNATQISKVQDYREGLISQAKYPKHEQVTRYWYNTLNQIIKEQTPDRGITRYWYDELGRPILSQDAQQAMGEGLFQFFSYTRYDDLGRVIESGVSKVPDTETLADFEEITYNTFDSPTSIFFDPFTERLEIVRTTYDAHTPQIIPTNIVFNQNNLRNRVAGVTYDASYIPDSDPNDDYLYDYKYATHYDYDISGNAKRVAQDYKELEVIDYNDGFPQIHNQRFNILEYDFSLHSGKVNQVIYQKHKYDQFIHRYCYDADNRIDYVETSKNGLLWDRDADYQYYLHGPLARTVLGEYQVQGLDYAYTLQGWTKTVNGTIVKGDNIATTSTNERTFDMGKDGDVTFAITGYDQSKYVSRDAYAYTLGYFDGDYGMVGDPTQFKVNFDLTDPTTSAKSKFNQYGRDLYNGNIARSTYGVKYLNINGSNYRTDGFAYRYDQLHRLRDSKTFQNYHSNNKYWRSAGSINGMTGPNESFTYDANGNIDRVTRNGDDLSGPGKEEMDDLTYKYYANNPNRLEYIIDNVADGNYTDDLDNQLPGNYIYDKRGNIIRDYAESLAYVWTADDKLSAVRKVTGQSTSDPSNDVTIPYMTFEYDAMRHRVRKAIQEAVETTPVTYRDKIIYWYTYDPQGNIMGVYKEDPNATDYTTFEQQEWHLYGSSRLGIKTDVTRITDPNINKATYSNLSGFSGRLLIVGDKYYELSNHLGNVLATISDRKLGRTISGNTTDDYDYFVPDVLTAQQYYAFGMPMPDGGPRRFHVKDILSSNTRNDYNFRFGFNGKENDDEVKGGFGKHQDYGFRVYDPRVGRFLSVDPLRKAYPWYTPYQFAGNMPILASDVDGLEPLIETGNIEYGYVTQAPIQNMNGGYDDISALESWTYIGEGEWAPGILKDFTVTGEAKKDRQFKDEAQKQITTLMKPAINQGAVIQDALLKAEGAGIGIKINASVAGASLTGTAELLGNQVDNESSIYSELSASYDMGASAKKGVGFVTMLDILTDIKENPIDRLKRGLELDAYFYFVRYDQNTPSLNSPIDFDASITGEGSGEIGFGVTYKETTSSTGAHRYGLSVGLPKKPKPLNANISANTRFSVKVKAQKKLD